MSNVLDEAAILALLSGEEKSKPVNTRPRPIQLGVVRWRDKPERCASRGCGSPTHITVVGVTRCTTHALYELNRLHIAATDPIADERIKNCTCKAGLHSVGNIHTSDCPTFIQISLDQEEENVGSSD